MAESLLTQALKVPAAGRARLLDEAAAWAGALLKPGDLLARITAARTGAQK